MPFMFETHGNNYTIPRKIRELQWRYRTEIRTTIIPYQEKLGNYNAHRRYADCGAIIPYQEKSAPSPKVAAPLFGAQGPFSICFEYTIFFFSLQRNQPRPFFGRAGFLYCGSLSNKLLNQILLPPPYEIPYISIQSLTCKK